MADTFADVSFILMDAFSNTVVRFVNVKGKQWDNANGEMAQKPTYADTAIGLAENANMNGIPVHIPLGLPDGQFHMMFYEAAVPAATDAYTRWYLINWNKKSREITMIRDMGPMA